MYDFLQLQVINKNNIFFSYFGHLIISALNIP